MEHIFRISLFIAGIINFIPSLIAFWPDKISKSYGIEIPDSNFELLLRHRAILFGIVGGLMIFSVFSKKYYDLSVILGLISMVSFLILYFSIDGINKELAIVMKLDAFAIVILIIGYLLYKVNG